VRGHDAFLYRRSDFLSECWKRAARYALKGPQAVNENAMRRIDIRSDNTCYSAREGASVA
jgi:hypothetical protein